ncbi:zinc finger protein 835-like isoform X2 [Galleria mellonella]|nr:zinc finger protein 835-like isoform X2 [Galleria mellonella]
MYQVEHPIALQIAGLEKPKRKRGRPPKKPKSTEELPEEEPVVLQNLDSANNSKEEPTPGKRRRKTPTRFKEAVQGKELERIFIEEGVIDGEESENDIKPDIDPEQKIPESKEPEIIGHMEDSGELVVVVKGKGRGRPKGRVQARQWACAQCGAVFSCAGRYMAHVAQHGPARCGCGLRCDSRLHLHHHQRATGHSAADNADTADTADTAADTADTAAATDHTPAAAGENLQNESKGETTPPQQTTDSPDLPPIDNVIDNVMASKSLPDLNPLLPENTTNTSEAVEVVPEDTKKDIEANENSIILKEIPLDTEGPAEVIVPDVKPRLKCNHCDKTFSTKQSKSVHIKAAHQGERPHVCGECGARFAYPRSLALHAVSHRRPRAARGFACDLCGKVLNHPSSVVYHKEAEHAGQRYVCNKCGKSFKHKQLLQRHQLVHSQLRPFTCKTCNASFKTKANLINHQLLHSGIKKFACEICKHRFAHKTSLTLHMRWHTGQKPFSCGVCGKSFSQKGNLSEHARIHTGEKPYACALCPRRFTTSSQHRLHARRHAQQPQHAQHPQHPQHAQQPQRDDRVTLACTHCPKRFASHTALIAHQRRVAAAAAGAGAEAEAGADAGGQRQRHTCGECGRSFGERWALVKHARRHTGERPFRCPHCPRAFADCSNLNKHKKQVHKQISLLVNDNNQPEAVEAGAVMMMGGEVEEAAAGVVQEEGGQGEGELHERVIYVAYDVDEPHSPAYHILDPEQAATLNNGKMLSTCELYPGPSLLVQHTELEAEPELHEEASLQQYDPKLDELPLKDEHITVTDEQGNPLHFTMQDGTQLAITSVDGKSLQVVTQDGQTIPVEINGYDEEEEEEAVEAPERIVHQLRIDNSDGTPVTHYFALV